MILVQIKAMLHKKDIMVIWIRDEKVVFNDEFLSMANFCICMGHKEGIPRVINVDEDGNLKWNQVLLLDIDEFTKLVVFCKIHWK